MKIENQEHSYLVVAKDPGAANCLSPMIERLKRPTILVAEDWAREIFERNFAATQGVSLALPESNYNAAIILASGTTDPDYEGEIISRFKKINPNSKLVLIEDFPGSLVRLVQKLAELKYPISADLIFVTSRSSQDYLNQRFPFIGKSKIIPVGQPAFDPLLTEDTQSINNKIRSSLRLQPHDLLIAFAGVPSQDRPGLNSEALRLFISALNQITDQNDRDIYFIYRNHPREIDPTQYISTLETASKRVKIINPSLHQDFSTREVTAAANLVANTTSTIGLEVALRGSRRETTIEQTGWLPIHLLLPQVTSFYEQSIGSMPVVSLEATAIAWGEGDIRNLLMNCLFNPVFKQRILDAQKGPLRKEYRFKKSSTQRVLLWLRNFEKFLKTHELQV